MVNNTEVIHCLSPQCRSSCCKNQHWPAWIPFHSLFPNLQSVQHETSGSQQQIKKNPASKDDFNLHVRQSEKRKRGMKMDCLRNLMLKASRNEKSYATALCLQHVSHARQESYHSQLDPLQIQIRWWTCILAWPRRKPKCQRRPCQLDKPDRSPVRTSLTAIGKDPQQRPQEPDKSSAQTPTASFNSMPACCILIFKLMEPYEIF